MTATQVVQKKSYLFWVKISLSVVAIPAMVCFALYSLNRQGFFNLSQVQVTVDTDESLKNFLKPRLQQLLLSLEPLKGQSLLKLSLADLKLKLTSEEWVSTVEITRHWPQEIAIVIRPTQLVALVKTARSLRPLTSKGELLSQLKTNEAPPLPIVVSESIFRKPELRNQLLQALNEIPQKGRFSNEQISEIYFDEQKGFWMKLIKNGMEVQLGQENFAMKSARVEQVLEYLDQHQIDARVIDANLSKKVLVRSRKNP